MIIPNLYVYHTFLELLKILKTNTPISLYSLFTQSQRDNNLTIYPPKLLLEISRINFTFKSSSLWNTLATKIFNKNIPREDAL